MSEGVKRGRGRPPKKAKPTSHPDPVAVNSKPATPPAEEPSERPGRRRSVPAKYRDDFVVGKVINIVPEHKAEEEYEEEADLDDNDVSSNSSTPVESSGKRKRGRPAGWRKFPERKPEKSPRPRGRPVGAVGKKKQQEAASQEVYQEEKSQYYYLDDEVEQSTKEDPKEKEEEGTEEDFNDISPDEVTPPPAKQKKPNTPVKEDEEEEEEETTVVIKNAIAMTPPRPEPAFLNEISSSPNAVLSSPNAVSSSPNAVSSSPNAVPSSPDATAKKPKPAAAGKRRLFVKTKDGKFLRLPDNADSLKLLSTSKLVLPSKPVPVVKPPVQLSLVGAQQVPESSLQMKKVSFSNVHRIDDLMKTTPAHIGKNQQLMKPPDLTSRSNAAKPQSKHLAHPVKVKAVNNKERTDGLSNAFQDSKDYPTTDDEEVELAVSEDEVESDFDDRPDPSALLHCLVEGKVHKSKHASQTVQNGWNYEGNEPLTVTELLIYSLLHCQGALLNYTPEKRSRDLVTIERVYNAMKLLDIPLPGDVVGLMDYICTMDDLTAESVGKIGSQRRWKYFFREVAQTVNKASSLLSKLLIQHWTKPQTLKLLNILKGVRRKSDCRLKATPVPSGRLGGADLVNVMALMETRLHNVLQRWDVRYLVKPEMICLTRTMYSTGRGPLQVITATLCILPSMLCEIRINDRVVDFFHMGFTALPSPLHHIDEIKPILEQISKGSICVGFKKKDLKLRGELHTRGDKVYKDRTKTGNPIARISGEQLKATNCTVVCAYKPYQMVKTICGACHEAQARVSTSNVYKGKRKHPSVCPDTGRPMVDLLKEERDLNNKLSRQVTRLKAGIAKFCMPGPFVEPIANMGGDEGFSGEVDSEEVVMATTTVQQQHQQGDVNEVEVPLEHALMMIN